MRTAPFEYCQASSVPGWEVIHVMRGPALLGTIVKRSAQLPYRFFAGSDNSIAFEWQHRDLDALKRLIESSYSHTSTPEPSA
jgi:hypothetical protein